MDEQKRIEEIKAGLKKSVYQEAERIKIEQSEILESTSKLSNILEGYIDRIDTMDAQNLGELEEELKILKAQNVEVGSETERDLLVKQYNDYIHNDLDRTIAETIEYTSNLDNHTDDLNEILIRPMDGVSLEEIKPVDDVEIKEVDNTVSEATEVVNTDELFEIEATTDLGVFEDIVELEEDTLDIEGTTVVTAIEGSSISSDDEIIVDETIESEEKPKSRSDKKEKKKSRSEKKQNKKSRNEKKEKQVKKVEIDEFDDEKGLTGLDYALIFVLIAVFAVLIGLVAKINGVF